MVQTELISSLTQNPESRSKSLCLQESSGENLLAFATAILCQPMAGQQVYVGIFGGGLPGVQKGNMSPSCCRSRLIKLDFISLELICMLRHWANNMKEV